MNEFEKAVLLREKFGISFEEAGNALRKFNGDLLDAMTYLERKADDRKYGTPAPEEKAENGLSDNMVTKNVDARTSYSSKAENTAYTAQNTQYTQKPEGPSFWSWLGHTLGSLVKKSMDNYLVVSHEGVVKFRMSIFVLVILFMVFHGTLLVAMVVSLFFGVKYSFAGKDDLSRANAVMDRAGNSAAEWWGNHSANPEVDDLCRKYDADDIRNKK